MYEIGHKGSDLFYQGLTHLAPIVIPTEATAQERSGQSRHLALIAARFLGSALGFARNDRNA